MKIVDAPVWQPAGNLLARNTSPFNVAGTCHRQRPLRLRFADGLPIGVSLAGRWWEEGLVLRAAHAYQTATDWHTRRPSLR